MKWDHRRYEMCFDIMFDIPETIEIKREANKNLLLKYLSRPARFQMAFKNWTVQWKQLSEALDVFLNKDVWKWSKIIYFALSKSNSFMQRTFVLRSE